MINEMREEGILQPRYYLDLIDESESQIIKSFRTMVYIIYSLESDICIKLIISIIYDERSRNNADSHC